MSRRIHCEQCGPMPLHSEDVEAGWQQRTVTLIVKKPAVHQVKVNDEPIDLVSILCDSCGKPIPNGTRAVAITSWRGVPISNWESEYGQVINPSVSSTT